MTAIKSVTGRRIWDSRGNPTVEVDVHLENGKIGRGIAPAGASRGTREAIDLRDGTVALQGKGVQQALDQVNGPIAEMLIGRNANDQSEIDNLLITLDGTPLKSKLGGNAMVASSLAVLHAAAADAEEPLWQYVANQYDCAPSIPLPEIQIFGGGAHAGRRVDIQDFMIMVPGANSFDEVMEITNEVYFAAGSIMEQKGNLAGVADEGGWWPVFQSNEEALETLTSAIELAGEKPGERVVISLDVAASEFGQNGKYRLALEDRDMDSGDLIDMLEKWIDAYPIASIEDPVGEEDRDGMIEFTRRFGDRIQIIGDDFLVTNAGLVETAAHDHACNAVLIKVNQAGTVTESIDTFRQVK